jgi:hypothetical protein
MLVRVSKNMGKLHDFYLLKKLDVIKINGDTFIFILIYTYMCIYVNDIYIYIYIYMYVYIFNMYMME